jgi:uncharacterized protein (TIGR00661 family)
MRILYGVQATGNGHITRARAIAPKLAQAGARVDWLFSGRPWEKLFEMDAFGDYQWRAGLTFATQDGHVQYLKTAWENPLGRFVRDVKNLDLSGYDLVVSDFEPVTAWAARLRGVESVGIGHQYAFNYDVPRAGTDFLGEKILRWFAPATISLGIHWHHFHHPILPPMIEPPAGDGAIKADKIVVYLPFEDVDRVIRLCERFPAWQFYIYSPSLPDKSRSHAAHVHVRQLSRAGFLHDFADAAGVICNAGFELASEALQTGKKLLVKPLRGQLEQLANAQALELLQLGEVMQSLDAATIETWLERGGAVRVDYPDVAQAVADWLVKGESRIEEAWIAGIWEQTVQTRL